MAAAAVQNRKKIDSLAKKLDFCLEFPHSRCIIYANLPGRILTDMSYVITLTQSSLPLVKIRV